MAETQSGSGQRPGGRGSAFLFGIWTLATVCGLAALALAAIGWSIQLWPIPPTTDHPSPATLIDAFARVVDIAVRTVKVLLLSDIYLDDNLMGRAKFILQPAGALGVVSSVLIGIRLLLFAVGTRLSEWAFRAGSWGHDVVIGTGAAAVAYAAHHGGMFKRGRAIHMADARQPTGKRLATYARYGSLDTQLRHSVASRARRIVVDEGDDPETWATAQAIARAYPKIEILAHITDPWMRDRLSRETPTARLSAFSYAGGAARQIMLAHPPYLLAGKLGSPAATHILIVGFGQVGQSLAREFVVTSAMPGARMIVTVIDPAADRLDRDFRSRHPDLCTRPPTEEEKADPAKLKLNDDLNRERVEFHFIDGDFRLNNPDLFDKIRQSDAAAPICAVYVAIDDNRRPLSLALAIQTVAAQQSLFRAPIFVCAQHGAGLQSFRNGAGLVGDTQAPRTDIEQRSKEERLLCDLCVASFGCWREAFDGAGLLESTFDERAQLYHRAYNARLVEEARQAGRPPKYAPTPWSLLTDQLRVSNRRAAAHVRAKAAAAGFDLDSWLARAPDGWLTQDVPGPAGGSFPLPDTPLMNKLAELEHRRWMLDRWLDGWRLGKRSDHARLREDFLPFARLDRPTQEQDEVVITLTKQLLDKNAGKPGRQR